MCQGGILSVSKLHSALSASELQVYLTDVDESAFDADIYRRIVAGQV